MLCMRMHLYLYPSIAAILRPGPAVDRPSCEELMGHPAKHIRRPSRKQPSTEFRWARRRCQRIRSRAHVSESRHSTVALGPPVKACWEQTTARLIQLLRCSRKRRLNGANQPLATYASTNHADAVSEATAQATG